MENKDGVIEEIIEDEETLEVLEELDTTITESNPEYEVVQDDMLEDISEESLNEDNNIEVINQSLNEAKSTGIISNDFEVENPKTVLRPQDAGKEIMSFEALVDKINDDKKEDYEIVEEKLGDNKKLILLVVFSVLLAIDIVALILYIMM
jgi:hypothetical protein